MYGGRKEVSDVTEEENLLMTGRLASQFFTDTGTFKSAMLSATLRKAFHIKTLRDNLEIYIYNEQKGFYEPNGEQLLREIIHDILGEKYHEAHARLTIYDITATTAFDRKDLEPPLYLISFQNGILDISKNPFELLPHSPEYFFTNVSPVEYNPNAKEPKIFLKFLEQIQPHALKRQVIQQMFGYCLLREYPYQIAFLLVGGGANGRSTLLGVLRSILGKDNVSAESLHSLLYDKFSKAELYHKYANVSGEMSSRTIKDTSEFRKLTGGDLISAQKKHKDPFNFINYAKLIFLVNKAPLSYDDTDSYFRRWRILHFPIQFGIHLGNRPADKHILKKITTPEELSGILNWALEGLSYLNEYKEFLTLMSVEQTREYYQRLQNPLFAFIQDRIQITLNPENFIPKEEFYDSLLTYCKEKEIVAPTYSSVGRMIKKLVKGIGDGHPKIGEKQVYAWTGCRFKLSKEEEEKARERGLDKAFDEA